jgi:ppGpp synthetase/RelA/SpoT-type nucleotidyltranferase
MQTSDPATNKKQLNDAGDVLRSEDAGRSETTSAFLVIENWRSAHSKPLHIATTLLRRATLKVQKYATVSSRLKRMDTIVAKLKRAQTQSLELSTMQDIGGCRAVMWDISDVVLLERKFEALRNDPNVRIKDYIRKPKPDGYRSIHVIFKYQRRSKRLDNREKITIEFQIRSTLQHAWATAVETVDAFSRQKLKAGAADERWQRFFVLASSVFAMHEYCPAIENAPTDESELRQELSSLWNELKVLDLLHGWATAAGHLPEVLQTYSPGEDTPTLFVLLVDFSTKSIKIDGFSSLEIDAANRRYADLEKQIRDGLRAEVVLASVEKIFQLREAFPNFYADTREFTKAIAEFLGEDILYRKAASMKD